MPIIALFEPKGIIALMERNLIITAVLVMATVAIPVFITLFVFAFKYRAGDTKSEYAPDSDHSAEYWYLWWLIPGLVILILTPVAWQTTHQLDPFKHLVSDVKPLKIQVVALQWKWLFIYPEQNIATVNYIQFPAGTPLDFELTADAPMNSFWIPQLGGQIYAMPGMSTELHLIADEPGEFAGSAAEINGKGFAGMRFVAKATSGNDFNHWAELMKASSQTLDLDSYNILAMPSENNRPSYYSSVEAGLYDRIIQKYLAPPSKQ